MRSHCERQNLLTREHAVVDAQIVEVLPRAEYEWMHIEGAINLPLKELNRESAGRLDRSRPVVTYCNDFQ